MYADFLPTFLGVSAWTKEKTTIKIEKENEKKKLIFLQHLEETDMKIIKEIEHQEVELWGHLDCYNI